MAEPHLRDVNTPLPNPPYAADTRAAGWRFQLDTTRIRQSDTWTLARPEIRPWLLMLWMVAWEQAPCGSLPADEALIGAKLGIESALFTAHRSVILRGWIKHNDMRLYHLVVTSQVLEMLSIREANRDRQSRKRNTSRVTHALVTDSIVGSSRESKNKGLTAKPVDNLGRWWKTLDSIVETGRSVGILAAPGEDREALYQRVKAALKAKA